MKRILALVSKLTHRKKKPEKITSYRGYLIEHLHSPNGMHKGFVTRVGTREYPFHPLISGLKELIDAAIPNVPPGTAEPWRVFPQK